jgi:hypothetical protein
VYILIYVYVYSYEFMYGTSHIYIYPVLVGLLPPMAWLGLAWGETGVVGGGAMSQTGRGLVSAGFAQAFWGELEGGVWRSGQGVGVGGRRGLGWTPLGPLPLGSRSIYCCET